MSTSHRTAINDWARDVMRDPERVVILDTETTGLHDAEIVDIALVNGAGDVLLNTRVKPTQPIPMSAIRIHGITDLMVSDAPTWVDVSKDVFNLIIDRQIVVYNAAYDRNMLFWSSKHADCLGIDWSQIATWHCAMLQYAEYVGEWDDWHGNYRWHKLVTACRQCGIPDPDAPAHTALGDCLRTLALVKYLASQ